MIHSKSDVVPTSEVIEYLKEDIKRNGDLPITLMMSYDDRTKERTIVGIIRNKVK